MTICEDVDAALAELALGTLTGPHAAELRAHLRTCTRHSELRDFTFAATALAFEPEPVPPPQGLRSRILSSATPSARDGRSRRFKRRLAVATAAAAAFVIVTTTSLLAWSPWSRSEGAPLIAQEIDEERGISVEFRRTDAGVSVTLLGLASPPSGMAYQLWLVQGDTWVPLRSFSPDRQGRWQGDVAFNFAPGDRVCITLESAAGAQWPTSAPIVFVTIGQ